MPTYVYRREDGTTFEIKQRITEDPLDTCPETGQDVERIITGNAGLIFKGDGFYVNDYADNSSNNGSSKSDSSPSSESDSAADNATSDNATSDTSPPSSD
jgi:putative FmdB family regulatory protein